MGYTSAEPRIRRAVRRAGGYSEAAWHFLLVIVFGGLGFSLFLAYKAAYILPRSLWRHGSRWYKLAKGHHLAHLTSPVFGDDQG